MVIVIGLVILVAAVVIGVAGVLSNGGAGHALVHPFAVFGYHVTGSAGALFLYGIVIGAIAVAGLSLLLAGARRTSRRGREARRSLRESRRETAAVSADRDDLIGQRDSARAYTASTLSNGSAYGDRDLSADSGADEDDGAQQGKWHLFGRRSASRQDAAALARVPSGYPVPVEAARDVPADAE